MECVKACIICQQPFRLRNITVFSTSSKPDRHERKICSPVCHQWLQYCLGLSHGFVLFRVLHDLCNDMRWTQCTMPDTSVDKDWTNLPRKISEDGYSDTEVKKELQHVDQGEDEISYIRAFFDDASENEQEFGNECVASSEKDSVHLLTQTPPLACNNSSERNIICKVRESGITERNHRSREVQHESNSMHSTKSETESRIHCQFCSSSFAPGDHQGLAEHLCEVHTTQIRLDVICDICGVLFPEREALRQHKKTEHCTNMTRGGSEEINKHKCPRTIKAHHKNPPMHDGNRLQAKTGGGTRHWCHQCNKTYPTKLQHQRHNQFVHSQQTPVECGVCGKPFRNSLLLKRHSQFMHSKQTSSKCFLCGKAFRNINLLNMHTKVAHKVRVITDHGQGLSLQCVYCSHTFSESSQDAISNHLAECHDKTAPPSPRFSCKVSGADFRNKMTVTGHFKHVHDSKDGLCVQTGGKTEKKRKTNRSQCEDNKRKSDKKRYPCDKCGKTYTQSALSKHIRIYHTTHDPVDCTLCGKTLINAFHLSQHKRQHVPTRICHICGANFKTDAGLHGHLAAHRGTKSHVCDVCGVGFVRKTSWQRHVKLHTETVPLQCECCPKTFKTVYSLNTHMLGKHHQGVFFHNRIRTLEEVGYIVDKDAISRHLNHQCAVCSTDMGSGVCPSHPEECKLLFKCNYCELVLRHVNDLCLHLKTHNLPLAFVASTRNFTASWSAKRDDSDVDYTCQVCHKSFGRRENLAGHMKQHREKAYECPICRKRFTYKCNMKNHLCTHCDDKPFPCELCHKAFKSKQLLTHHRLVHNLSESPFKCQVCGKGLTRKSFLQRHYKQMHPGVTV